MARQVITETKNEQPKIVQTPQSRFRPTLCEPTLPLFVQPWIMLQIASGT